MWGFPKCVGGGGGGSVVGEQEQVFSVPLTDSQLFPTCKKPAPLNLVFHFKDQRDVLSDASKQATASKVKIRCNYLLKWPSTEM